MTENIYKIVYFDEYCHKCKYFALDDNEDPCDECLIHMVNTYSHKPVNFKEETKK